MGALYMTADELRVFEAEVAEAFKAKKIPGPIHLSGGNEEDLILHFENIAKDEWVFSTYRSHYHALLHGIPRDWLMAEILAGRSMNIASPQHKFMTSAIVGGMLPIAVGVAAALKRSEERKMVHVFVGDMAASTGAFHEATQYAKAQWLPICFYVEDNGMSCDSPTKEVWGTAKHNNTVQVRRHTYKRIYPHSGTGEYVF